VTPIDHAARIGRVADEVAGGVLLVTDLTDLRWLTGFDTSNGWAVVRSGELIVGTDGRYGDKAIAETAGTGARVIVEQDRARLQQQRDELSVGATNDGLIRRLRRVKDAAEIERIEEAARIADAALGEVEPMLAGASELDVRAELEYRMVGLGADDRSYPTIVASGPDHAARPHHGASRRTIQEGDTVIVDVGALVDGYHSDMTRSWVIGLATEQQRDVYELVVKSQQAGLDAVAASATSRDVDAACRNVFDQGGMLDWYLHATGHGVGLDIHEQPFHNQASEAELLAGMVVTVEPGLYRGGFGGFRIEDLVLVTDAGHRVLTHSPKRELN
jgi:Xaa-Pro aminopeptidase